MFFILATKKSGCLDHPVSYVYRELSRRIMVDDKNLHMLILLYNVATGTY